MSYEQLGQHVQELGERAYRQGERTLAPFLVSSTSTRRWLSVLAGRCFQDLPAQLAPYRGLPDPAGFDPVIARLDAAARALYAPHDADLPSPEGTPLAPNPALAGLTSAAGRLTGWTGHAARAFRAEIVDPFPSVVRNQCLSVVVAGAAVRACQALWAQVRIVVDQLVVQAIRAVDLLGDGCRRHEWGVDFAGFEAVEQVLRATVPRSGFPVGSATTVLPAGLPTGRLVLRIGGATVSAVLDAVATAVDDLTRSVNAVEQGLSWWVREVRGLVGRPGFTLVTPSWPGTGWAPPVGGGHRPGHLTRHAHDVAVTGCEQTTMEDASMVDHGWELGLDLYQLHLLATRDLPEVTEQYDVALLGLVDAPADPRVFARSEVFGGQYGPLLRPWTELCADIQACLARSADGLRATADALLVVVQDYAGADDQASAELDRLRGTDLVAGRPRGATS